MTDTSIIVLALFTLGCLLLLARILWRGYNRPFIYLNQKDDGQLPSEDIVKAFREAGGL